MKPKVSVIMSAYNAEDHLDECVQSILSQSLAEFEFIIIDDNSSDDSGSIIRRHAGLDNRIVHLTNSDNIGLTKSLNIGINMARGEYIARQDADDASLPDRLQVQYQYLEAHKDLQLLGTNALISHAEHGTFVKGAVRGINKINRILSHNNVFVHSSIMFRNYNRYYRDKFYYAQDYDLCLCLLREGHRMDNLATPLIKYRVGDTAITTKKSQQQFQFAQKAREFYNDFVNTGQDRYCDFDPEQILRANPQKDIVSYSGTEQLINYLCYYNKMEALRLLFSLWRTLSRKYICVKLIVVLIPAILLEYKHLFRIHR